MKVDVLVIGGGAAGLMCAIAAGQRGRSVLVTEQGIAQTLTLIALIYPSGILLRCSCWAKRRKFLSFSLLKKRADRYSGA